MATTAGLIKQMAEILGISERKLRSELLELGLDEVMSQARRLQHRDLFGSGQLALGPRGPVTHEQLREAYRAVAEGEA